MISALIGLILLLALTAGIALLAAFLLDVFARRMGVKTRSFIAAFFAGALPMIGPAMFMTTVDMQGSTFVAILPLIIAGIILMLAVGFPTALAFSRRRERARGEPVKAETFE